MVSDPNWVLNRQESIDGKSLSFKTLEWVAVLPQASLKTLTNKKIIKKYGKVTPDFFHGRKNRVEQELCDVFVLD